MKISVYITSYNQKGYLSEAVDSVLGQTLKPFEIIIIDDFSNDGSQNIIANYASCNPDLIKPIYNDKNLGIAQTRNKALRALSGDYVTYLDGDDRFLPRKLETESRCIERYPETNIVFSNFYSIDERGQRLWLWVEEEPKPPEGDIFIQTFARDFPKKIHFRNELVSYEALKSVNFYDTNLALYEDYDIRIRLTKKYHASFNYEPSSEYRRHSAGLSISKNMNQHLRDFKYLYQKNLSLLNDLDSRAKKYIQREINRTISEMIRRSSRIMIENDNSYKYKRMKALLLYLKSFEYSLAKIDVKSLAKVILPRKMYSWLEKKYIKFKKNKRKNSEKTD